jgi:Xaa-Pro aminopeptidase
MIINIRNFGLFSFLVFLFSCAEVKLIQEYDAVSNHKINILYDKATKFFVKLKRNIGLPENRFEKHIDFYDDLKSDIHILETRTKAIDKSAIVQKQINSLDIQIQTIEQLHKAGFKSKEEIELIQSAFDQTMTAILKLQVALKNKNNQ